MNDPLHSRTSVVVTDNLLPESLLARLCSDSLRAEANTALSTYC